MWSLKNLKSRSAALIGGFLVRKLLIFLKFEASIRDAATIRNFTIVYFLAHRELP